MDRPMRRKDRQLTGEDGREILAEGLFGVLATADEKGEPYAVPLSYVVLEDHLYFHCAREGRKIDCLRANPRAGLTVVLDVESVYDHGFSTYYRSAMVSGSVREVTGDEEKHRVLRALAEKYLPDHLDRAEPDIQKSWTRTAVYALKMEKITAKGKLKKS